MKMNLILVFLVALILLLSSCSIPELKEINSAPKQDSVTVSLNKITVEMTSNGFLPSNVNIKAGDTIVFHNADIANHWPASAVHPTHEELPGFDSFGPVKHGESYEFTFSEKGNWRFHDHLNPRLFGVVVAS